MFNYTFWFVQLCVSEVPGGDVNNVLTATSTKGSSSGVSAREERRPARAPGDPLELPGKLKSYLIINFIKQGTLLLLTCIL